MRNKISAIVFFLALVLGFLSALALAAFSPRIADSIESVTDGEDFQNYLDSGNASDWYVMAKTRRGAVADYGKYASELREALEQSGANAVSRQRMALALIMTDGDLMTAGKVLSETTGKQGVMSFIFALHLINNGAKAEGITAGGVADALASLVLESGGWAVSGNNSDVDVTAMALQALAPYADEYAGIVDRALEFLASKQLDDGDYRSYGVANPESGAQVIIALTALGIDALEDSRFVKNGNTLLDGMMKYAVSGGFSHTYDGEVNKLATQQIYCALVALERFYDGKSGFYDINNDVSVDESSTLSVDEYDKYVKKYPELANENLYKLDTKNKEDIKNLNTVMGKAIMVTMMFENQGNESMLNNMAGNNTDSNQITGALSQMPEGTDVFQMLSMMPKEQLDSMLSQVDEKISAVSDSMITQAATTYIKSEYNAIGINTDKLQ